MRLLTLAEGKKQLLKWLCTNCPTLLVRVSECSGLSIAPEFLLVIWLERSPLFSHFPFYLHPSVSLTTTHAIAAREMQCPVPGLWRRAFVGRRRNSAVGNSTAMGSQVRILWLLITGSGNNN